MRACACYRDPKHNIFCERARFSGAGTVKIDRRTNGCQRATVEECLPDTFAVGVILYAAAAGAGCSFSVRASLRREPDTSNIENKGSRERV